jgi:RNA polymerase sigma-70 factor (ECF subfamily)
MPAGPRSSSEPSDRELIQRASAGDRDAFGALYARYQQVVYRFARAMTGSADAAADVAQEVFVVFIRHLPRYDVERSALSTYLYGVTRNVSRERLRRERRFLSLDTIGLRLDEHDVADDPIEGLASAQAAARVRRALSMLPSRYREVIILCDLHDLPYAEAAAVVRVSVAAVRSRLHRGRLMLKLCLLRLERAAEGRPAHPVRCSV